MSPVDNEKTARATFPAQDSNRWVLPVVGMRGSPSQYQPGGGPAWATGSYGYQKPASKGGHIHKGVDIYAERGAQIVAPIGGTIKSVGSGSTSGNYVKLQGDDGREYYFAHMDSTHTGLSNGMRVTAGSYLGGVGSTGNAAGTTTHLHFEIREGGRSINPNEFLKTGRQQDSVPLSSIPGLNEVGQLQSYIDEDTRAQRAIIQQRAGGFDPSTWGQQPQQLSPEELAAEQSKAGHSMLSSTFSMLSNRLAGGQRKPMPRVSSAIEGQTGVPTAAEQRQEPAGG